MSALDFGEREKIASAWKEAVEKWKRNHRSAAYQTGQWIDLAEKEFEMRCEGKTEDHRFDKEAPTFANLVLTNWALKWAGSGRRRRRGR